VMVAFFKEFSYFSRRTRWLRHQSQVHVGGQDLLPRHLRRLWQRSKFPSVAALPGGGVYCPELPRHCFLAVSDNVPRDFGPLPSVTSRSSRPYR